MRQAVRLYQVSWLDALSAVWFAAAALRAVASCSAVTAPVTSQAIYLISSAVMVDMSSARDKSDHGGVCSGSRRISI